MLNHLESYSIILPTYNECGHIEDLTMDIFNIFKSKNLKFEIIIVDDESEDGTFEIVQKLDNKYPEITAINRKNKKKNLVESIKHGIRISNYKNIIWLDADYSHPPQYLNNALEEKKNSNADIIMFSRFLKESKRYYENKMASPKAIDQLSILLNKICNVVLFEEFTDYTSGYILINKEFLDTIELKGYYGDYFINLLVDAKLLKKKVLEIPYIEQDRKTGQSKTTKNFFKFLLKCYFYLYSIFIAYLKKLKILKYNRKK